jgi:hypothetical protein
MRNKHLYFTFIGILSLILVACSESRANKKYNDALVALKAENLDQAEKMLKEIVTDFPDTKTADIARKQLIELNSAKIKSDMASYYAKFSPKFGQLKNANINTSSTTNQDSTKYSTSGNIEEFRKIHADLVEIKPKTSEIQLIHQKICNVILSGIIFVEEIAKITTEPDPSTTAKLNRMDAETKKVEKELTVLLEKISTEHKSEEAKQLIIDLNLGPRTN